MFKPSGYTSVAPYLTVDGAQQTIDFLCRVFGAEPLRVTRGDGGRLAHAEVRIDDTVVMLTDATEGRPAVPSHVHIYVPDVDATCTLAIAVGATAVKEPVQADDDADTRGAFRDAGGTTWRVGTRVGGKLKPAAPPLLW